MFNISRGLKDVVRRISQGETVPVTREYEETVSKELLAEKISFQISGIPGKENVVFFQRDVDPFGADDL